MGRGLNYFWYAEWVATICFPAPALVPKVVWSQSIKGQGYKRQISRATFYRFSKGQLIVRDLAVNN